VRQGRWYTSEDDDIVLNFTREAAAEFLGVTVGAIQHRRRYLRSTPEQLARRREKQREYDRIRNGPTGAGHKPQPRPRPKTIEDRDRRADLQPATLTARIFGDPLPGYSALDRRSSCGRA
jgi:hypothetical protein